MTLRARSRESCRLRPRSKPSNCATLRGEGAMSALFGLVKGAFTGAAQERTGLLRTANHGVLFLGSSPRGRFRPNPIIHCVAKALLASQVPFRCLYRNASQQELNLLDRKRLPCSAVSQLPATTLRRLGRDYRLFPPSTTNDSRSALGGGVDHNLLADGPCLGEIVELDKERMSDFLALRNHQHARPGLDLFLENHADVEL